MAGLDVEELIDDLFEARPDEFVARRNEAARRLREEGQREDAERVKALRRPQVTAWALNQLARRRPDDVGELISAGQQLHRAQRQAIKGTGEKLREQTRRVRSLAVDLARDADRLLEEEGVASSGRQPEAEGALMAAVGDPEVCETLKAGRLEKVPEAAAAPGMWAAGADVEDVDEAELRRSRARRDQEAVDRARDREERAGADLRRAEGRLERHRDRVADLQDQLERERDAVKEAEKQVSDRREAVERRRRERERAERR